MSPERVSVREEGKILDAKSTSLGHRRPRWPGVELYTSRSCYRESQIQGDCSVEIFMFNTSAFDFPLPGKHSTKQAKRLAKDLRQGVERAKSSMDVDFSAGNREGEYHVCLVIPAVHIRMCK